MLRDQITTYRVVNEPDQRAARLFIDAQRTSDDEAKDVIMAKLARDPEVRRLTMLYVRPLVMELSKIAQGPGVTGHQACQAH